MKLIEAMAKEICRQQGYSNTELLVRPKERGPLIEGPKGSFIFPDNDLNGLVELWELFIGDARAALSVINKAQISEDITT